MMAKASRPTSISETEKTMRRLPGGDVDKELQVEAAAAKLAAESGLQASQTGFGVYNCPEEGDVGGESSQQLSGGERRTGPTGFRVSSGSEMGGDPERSSVQARTGLTSSRVYARTVTWFENEEGHFSLKITVNFK